MKTFLNKENARFFKKVVYKREVATQLLKKLGKFSPGFLRLKKSVLAFMYFKFDLAVYGIYVVLAVGCWLPSSS